MSEEKEVINRIPAQIESADFGPYYEGESYVTVTFRVPKDTRIPAGKWDLIPRETGTYPWAEQKAKLTRNQDL